jgi:hypothetical protein
MSEGQRKWSEVTEEEANEYRRGAAGRVAAPAAALIVVGCLGLATNLSVAVLLNAIRQDRGPVERPAGMDDATYQAYERGRATAPLLDCCLISIPTLAVYPIVILGGVRMRRSQSRWLATLGAVLAMGPCSPAMLIGLPVGVWALIVLSRPEVWAAFGAPGPAGR